MGSSQTRNWTWVPCIGRWILIHCTTREVRGQCPCLSCPPSFPQFRSAWHIPVTLSIGLMTVKMIPVFPQHGDSGFDTACDIELGSRKRSQMWILVLVWDLGLLLQLSWTLALIKKQESYLPCLPHGWYLSAQSLKLCPPLCDPMDCSTPSFPVLHHLPESLLRLLSIELMMPSNNLILCHPLLLPSIFPSVRVFSNESVLCIRWPKYWSFSISPSSEY